MRIDAAVFDFDTDLSKPNDAGPSRNDAYDEVKRDITVGGFTGMRDSTSVGGDTVDAVRRVRVVQKPAER